MNAVQRSDAAPILPGTQPRESTPDIFNCIVKSVGKQEDMSRRDGRKRVTTATSRLDKGHKILLNASEFEPIGVEMNRPFKPIRRVHGAELVAPGACWIAGAGPVTCACGASTPVNTDLHR
jgi:hypothetical protein